MRPTDITDYLLREDALALRCDEQVAERLADLRSEHEAHETLRETVRQRALLNVAARLRAVNAD